MIPIQGSSLLATPAKQDGLTGIVHMMTLMRKNMARPVAFIDAYCGNGVNSVDEKDINGSPISILEGICKAVASMSETPNHPRFILFNDIIESRVKGNLPVEVEQWQMKNGLPVNQNELVCYNKKKEPFRVSIIYEAKSANDLCDAVVLKAVKNGCHVVVFVDPNGPKHAPWEKLKEIYKKYPKNVEMIFSIAGNTLKRVYGARLSTGYNFSSMPNHVADMIDSFADCGGWIREPIGADQWTMVLVSKFPPRNGWNVKTGPKFYKIDQPEGQQMVEYLSTTAKQRGLIQ